MKTKSLKALLEMASKDKNRPVLNAVHFINGKAEATDGFMVMQLPGDEMDEIIIPAEPLKQVAKTRSETVVIHKLTAESDNLQVIFEPIKASYPETAKVMPTEEPTAKVYLSVKLLDRLCKAMKQLQVETMEIGLYQDNLTPAKATMKPVLVKFKTSDGEPGKALVMPFKGEEL